MAEQHASSTVGAPRNGRVSAVGGPSIGRVAGYGGTRHRLRSTVVAPTLGAWGGDGRVTPPTGVLLYGPPGAPLVDLVAELAATLDVEVAEVDVVELLSGSSGDDPTELAGAVHRIVGSNRRLVHLARFDAVCELAPDAGDGVGAQRLAAALAEYSGGGGSSSLVVATSETPWAHHRDLFGAGRIDRMVFVPAPDWEARHHEIVTVLRTRGVSVPRGLERLVAATEGFTADDLGRLVASLPAGDTDEWVAAAASVQAGSVAWMVQARPMAVRAEELSMVDDLVGHLRRHRLA